MKLLGKSQLDGLTLRERIDVEMLNLLLNSTLLISDDDWNEKEQLKNYKKSIWKGKNIKTVKYVRSENKEYGRVCPEKCLGLHMIRRRVRHTLANKYYTDIDIVNAHPIMLLQICKKMKIKDTKCLEKYINERETILKTIEEKNKVDREGAKGLMLRIMYLGSYKKWLKENNNKCKEIDFINNFRIEINNISLLLQKKYKDILDIIKKDKSCNNINSSFLSILLQTIENNILENMYLYLKSQNIIKNECVLSNDGIMIPTNNFNINILKKMSNHIEKTTGFKLEYKEKPMNEGYTKEEILNNQTNGSECVQFFEELLKADQKYWALTYYENNKEEHLYSESEGWYSYNENNILTRSPNESAYMYIKICEYLQNFLDNYYNKLDPSEDNFKSYKMLYIRNRKYLGTTNTLKGILKLLTAYYLNEEIVDKIDYNLDLIAFSDKVFDFNINEYRKIEKSDYIYKNTQYEAPTTDNFIIQNDIEKTISSMFRPNDGSFEYTLDSIGFSIRSNSFEKLNIWTGLGRNGKGVITELTAGAFGMYYYETSETFLTSKHQGGDFNNELIEMKGCRFVSVSEPSIGNKTDKEITFNIEFIKKLTGGDKMRSRVCHGTSTQSYKPTYTTFVSCNERPDIDKIDDGIRNRFIFTEFPYLFIDNPTRPHEKKIDITLKRKISSNNEYASQFMRMLINRIKNKEDNLIVPQVIKEYTNECIDDNNYVGLFIKEYLKQTKNKTDKLKCSDVYNLYSKSEFPKITSKKFKNMMLYNGIQQVKNSVYYYTGLEYNYDEEEEEN
jgi:phage/plasmid-associated DNA primase